MLTHEQLLEELFCKNIKDHPIMNVYKNFFFFEAYHLEGIKYYPEIINQLTQSAETITIGK